MSWEVLLIFDTEDPEFARGFEAARLWERARAEPERWSQTVRASNGEMVLRIAELAGRDFEIEYHYDDDGHAEWATATFF